MSDSAGASGGDPEHGVPTRGKVVPDRFSSDEVFQRVVADAEHEVTSSVRELFFSALAAGFAITITYLLYASMSTTSDSKVVAALLYPLGFVYIIIGGYQLYTENTLPPVALTLERLTSVPSLFRHWSIVLAGNFLGGALGAVTLAYGGVFDDDTRVVAVEIARKGIETPAADLFFKAAFAGLIVAGVVWMNFAATDTTSRVLVVYLAFLAIPLGNLFHVVVSFTEVVFLVLVDDLALAVGMTDFVVPVLLGNTLGGVLLVTVVNYYQTSEQRLEIARFENVRRLSVRETFLGNLAGRTYVPLVDTLEEITRDPESYRILVPIANPRTETGLVEFACTLASSHEKGVVHTVHVVQAPTKRSRSYEIEKRQRDRIVAESERLLEDVRRVGNRHDVGFETSTIVSPRSFEEVFDRARRTRPDLVAIGWEEGSLWNSARAERPIDELTNNLPCDFVVAKDRGLDPSRVLLPTAGGPDSALNAEVARTLQSTSGSSVTLLHVVDGPGRRDRAEEFLAEWATEHDLEDVTLTVEEGGDIEEAIVREADDATMLLLGATERGMLSRLVTDSLHLNVVDEVDCSVILAERPHERSLRERLFGGGQRAEVTRDRDQ